MRSVVLIALCVGCGGQEDSHGGITGLTIDPSTARVEPRKMQQFTARAMYGDHSAVDVTAAAQWSIADPTLGQVEKGSMTAYAAGMTTITVSYAGAQTSAAVTIPGPHQLSDDVLWTAPDSQTSVYSQVLATNDEGRAMLAASINGPSQNRITTWSYDGAWHQSDVGATDFVGSTGVDIELALGPSGAAGLVYQATDGSTSFMRYGVALYDGNWYLLGVHAGSIFPIESVVTPSVAMDNQPTLFVAYATLQQTLGVSRFDYRGLLDEVTFPEAVGIMPAPYVVSNGVGQVMVLTTAAGSHVFDGFNWGPLAPFPDRLAPPGVLRLADDGTAQFINLGGPVEHYQFAAGGWSAGVQLGMSGAPAGAAAAIDRSGRALAAYDTSIGPSGHAFARTFDGTSWSDPRQMDSTAVFGPPVYALTNGSGSFVAMWGEQFGFYYDYFDGAWRSPAGIEPGQAVAMLADGRIISMIGGAGGAALHARVYELIP